MSLHRRAAKRDANEPGIIRVLVAHGCVVWQLSGNGIPDLLVMRNGKTWIADVKNGPSVATKAQKERWEEAASKAGCPVFILRAPEDAVAMLNDALAPWEPAAATRARPGHATPKGMGMHLHSHDLPDGRLRNPPTTGAKAGRMDYVEAYTPPRSTPVDAAMEAEAFAPPPRTPGEAVMAEWLQPPQCPRCRSASHPLCF